MNCSHCHRVNLPGGVRCIYCGTHFPTGNSAESTAAAEFDFGTDATQETPANVTWSKAFGAGASTSITSQGNGKAKAGVTGALGSLAILVLKAKSLLTLLSLGKVLLTLGTMLVSIAAYSRIYNWKLAIGFVVCIFIHEMGHVIVNWRKGIPQTPPMFIPFIGALILIKRFPDDPTLEAESGAGGPVAGGIAAFVCLAIAHFTGSPYWYALAFLGFAINLWNLTPISQLDGAHMAAAFSPKVWSAALIAMLLWALKVPSAFLWALILVGFVVRLSHADTGRYLMASPAARARVALLYVVLGVSLGWGADHTMRYMPLYRTHRPSATRATAAPSQSADPAMDAAETERVPGDEPVSYAGAIARYSGFGEMGRADRFTPVVGVFVGTQLALVGLIWLGTASLLAKTASYGTKKATALRLPAAGLLLYVGLWTLLHFLPISTKAGCALLGADWAATLGAFTFAAYAAARRGSKLLTAPPVYSTLRARSLAWAAGASLLVAWATGSVLVFLTIAIVGLAYYLRYPWQALGAGADVAASVGDTERALGLLERAAARAEKQNAASAAYLWWRVAEQYLRCDRGGPALAALDRYEALLSNQPMPHPTVTAGYYDRRAAALSLLDRHSEALTCCEQTLRLASSNMDPRLSNILNFLVHVRLARLAYLRGWFDESSAQAISCLRRAANTKLIRAQMHIVQAEALAGMEIPDSALQTRLAVKAALTACREPEIQTSATRLLAQAALSEGKPEEARREAERALRLQAGSLAMRYSVARIRLALQKGSPVETGLLALARQFPEEYWGRRAAADLAAARDAGFPASL